MNSLSPKGLSVLKNVQIITLFSLKFDNQMHWMKTFFHFSIFLIFVQTFSPRCRIWSKLQSIKHEKKPLLCVKALQHHVEKKKYIECHFPKMSGPFYIHFFRAICLLMKIWQKIFWIIQSKTSRESTSALYLYFKYSMLHQFHDKLFLISI